MDEFNGEPGDVVRHCDRHSVHAKMPADRLRRSTISGIAIFFFGIALYTALVVCVAAAPDWRLQTIASFATGVQVAILFVIGHDACHGSLTPHRWLNRVIGTISFLPSWHPFSAWMHTHNGVHHVWTNVGGVDMGYPPFSKPSYDRLPPWRRIGERLLRSPLGVLAFYFFTVYFQYEMFPSRDRKPSGRAHRSFQYERFGILVFGILLCIVSTFIARWAGRPVWLAILLVLVMPSACFFSVLSFVTYLHHTHPRVPWYTQKEFNYFNMLQATVHVEFPPLIDIVLHNILQHTAHHADMRIPLYNLRRSQEALEIAFPDDVVRVPWSWKGYFHTVNTCRLFDYERHCWLDWDGTPTTAPLLNPQGTGGIRPAL